jgi:hypothetical protein
VLAFELRGFRLEEEWLSFYIRPADALQLPAIMQWLKQTFAVRFNLGTGEDRAYLGRPVLVAGGGGGAAGVGRGGGLGGGGCDGSAVAIEWGQPAGGGKPARSPPPPG